MPVITFSSAFGTGGSVVASGVAERLGWKLINRLIPQEVASSLSVPLEAALAHDESSDSRIGRLFVRLSAQFALDAAGHLPAGVFLDDESFRMQSEIYIRAIADDSDCVIVGRASAIVLANLDAALHVRLDGDPGRRVVQAANALKISTQESTLRLVEVDRARALYVKHFYGRDWADPRLYHLVLDSTVLSLPTCVEIVLAAAANRFPEVDWSRNPGSD
jgi:cytidylate kinase